jgi:hypothetical protein
VGVHASDRGGDDCPESMPQISSLVQSRGT